MTPRERRQRPHALHLEDISFSYSDNGQPVLQGFDLLVAPGECVALVGPNGCGKTTLANVAFGLLVPTSGEVRLGTSPVTQPIRSGAFVFQGDSLLPWFKVLDGLMFALECHSVPSSERHQRAVTYLAHLGVENAAGLYPWQLSGGMRQRVSLARALSLLPEVLVLDEPYSSLDSPTRERLQEDIARARSELHFSVILVTHDVDEAAFLADRVLILSARPARIVEEVTSPFGEERRPELRTTKAFVELRTQLWTGLRKVCNQGVEQLHSR